MRGGSAKKTVTVTLAVPEQGATHQEYTVVFSDDTPTITDRYSELHRKFNGLNARGGIPFPPKVIGMSNKNTANASGKWMPWLERRRHNLEQFFQACVENGWDGEKTADETRRERRDLRAEAEVEYTNSAAEPSYDPDLNATQFHV